MPESKDIKDALRELRQFEQALLDSNHPNLRYMRDGVRELLKEAYPDVLQGNDHYETLNEQREDAIHLRQIRLTDE